MNEAAQRVSQFLVWQTLINIAFGALVAAGMYWIGVPYPALWGGLTAVLRFVPYVGTALSALMPAALAFATFPGWTEALQTVALMLSLDLVAAYFVEPVIFGRRTGVSSFALLVSALFWIWVWGPVGLLLATPLTVCIAVLGRHVRPLRFLAIIFADEPALLPHVRFYQRLLARDEDEANLLVSRKLTEAGTIGVIDQLLIPAVELMQLHQAQNEITDEDSGFMLDVMAETLQQLPASDVPASSNVLVGIAARSATDQFVLEMLRAAMGHDRLAVVPGDLSPDEAVRAAIRQHPALVCVVAASTTRGSELRNYCRRLRSELPDVKLLVLRPQFADEDASRSIERFKDAGADSVVLTAKDAVEAVCALLPTEYDRLRRAIPAPALERSA
jgi:methylmalonyl-CoA mutase cobalamin-binding subunit